MRILKFLYSLARFDLANWGVLQPVQPHTDYAPLLVFDETSAQVDFAAVNIALTWWWMFFTLFYAQSDIFAVMNCCAVALCVFLSDILTWSADNLYSVQW